MNPPIPNTGLHADAITALESMGPADKHQQELTARFLRYLRAQPDAASRQCGQGHITASALIVSADRSDVLLVWHQRNGQWQQSGGHCRHDDTRIADTALREAREESGIAGLAIQPVPIRLAHYDVPACGALRSTQHFDMQYVAVAETGSTAAPGCGWWPAGRLPAATDDSLRDLVGASTGAHGFSTRDGTACTHLSP